MACLYCGDGTYLKNPDEVSRKLCAMVNKLKPDVVMCGPCFNYLNYGKMAARIAYDINQNTSSKAFAAMSDDNQETINEYKDSFKPIPPFLGVLIIHNLSLYSLSFLDYHLTWPQLL